MIGPSRTPSLSRLDRCIRKSHLSVLLPKDLIFDNEGKPFTGLGRQSLEVAGMTGSFAFLRLSPSGDCGESWRVWGPSAHFAVRPILHGGQFVLCRGVTRFRLLSVCCGSIFNFLLLIIFAFDCEIEHVTFCILPCTTTTIFLSIKPFCFSWSCRLPCCHSPPRQRMQAYIQ